MSKKIFISYASADQGIAERVVREIEKRGVPCWIAFRDIKLGTDYREAITEALEDSAAMVLLFSQNAIESTEIPKELSLASHSKKKFIAARIQNINPKGSFLYEMITSQYIDLFHNFDENVIILCKNLADILKTSEYVDAKIRLAQRARTTKRFAIRSAVTSVVAAMAFAIWSLWPKFTNIPQALQTAQDSPTEKNISAQKPASASLLPKADPAPQANALVKNQAAPANGQLTIASEVQPAITKPVLNENFRATTPVAIIAPQGEAKYQDKNAARNLSESLSNSLNVVPKAEAALLIEVSDVYAHGDQTGIRCTNSYNSVWNGTSSVTIRMIWVGGSVLFSEKFTGSRAACSQDEAAKLGLDATLESIKEKIINFAMQ